MDEQDIVEAVFVRADITYGSIEPFHIKNLSTFVPCEQPFCSEARG